MARIFQKSRCRWKILISKQTSRCSRKFLICKHLKCRRKFLICKHPRCRWKFLWSFFINLAKILGKKGVSPINDYWGDFLSDSIFPQFLSVYVLVIGEKIAKLDNFPIVFGVSACFNWGKFLISTFFIQIAVYSFFVIGEFPRIFIQKPIQYSFFDTIIYRLSHSFCQRHRFLIFTTNCI